MKVGMVLEGGAMRGLFTAGVLDVMLENDIPIDGIIGVSAGAVFGCNYKSRQIGRAVRYNTRFCNDRRYGSFRSWIKTGDIFDTDFCYRELPEELDVFDTDTYATSPIEFYTVCTDLYTGKAVYHRCDNGLREDLLWFRASASLPMFSKVVEIGDERLLDGGIGDSIPLKKFEEMGFERNIVILTRERDYVKGKNRLLPLMKCFLKGYPEAVRAMKHRHEAYNETTAYVKEREKEGKTLVIAPKEALKIKHVEHHPEKLREVYEIGRSVGMEELEHIKEFVSQAHKMA